MMVLVVSFCCSRLSSLLSRSSYLHLSCDSSCRHIEFLIDLNYMTNIYFCCHCFVICLLYFKSYTYLFCILKTLYIQINIFSYLALTVACLTLDYVFMFFSTCITFDLDKRLVDCITSGSLRLFCVTAGPIYSWKDEKTNMIWMEL